MGLGNTRCLWVIIYTDRLVSHGFHVQPFESVRHPFGLQATSFGPWPPKWCNVAVAVVAAGTASAGAVGVSAFGKRTRPGIPGCLCWESGGAFAVIFFLFLHLDILLSFHCWLLSLDISWLEVREKRNTMNWSVCCFSCHHVLYSVLLCVSFFEKSRRRLKRCCSYLKIPTPLATEEEHCILPQRMVFCNHSSCYWKPRLIRMSHSR